MENILQEKLKAYILMNNPELVSKLDENYSLSQYLKDKVEAVGPLMEQLFEEEKPVYVIEELCLNEMTADLKPSRFNYVKSVLEEEFREEYEGYVQSGVLNYETINLVAACKRVFDDFDFSEANEDNRHLRYAIISEVHDYLV